MDNSSESLNKFLRFAIEVLKERFGIEGKNPIKFNGKEKDTLRESIGILNSEIVSPSGLDLDKFGIEGKDCSLPLKSIFSEIYLSKKGEFENSFIYPDLDKIPFPQPLDCKKQVISDSLKKAFSDDYNFLYKQKALDNSCLLVFIEKYGGFLPTSKALQSLPVYDYVKILGATFTALLSSNEEGNTLDKLMLIGGDLSGIQDFIFSISSKGALKSYRARSFYLEILVQHTVNKIIETLNLSDSNVVYASGGGFLILAPNVSEDKIVDIRKSLNKWLFSKFRGLISISIATVPFKKIGESISELSDNLEMLKAHKFSDFIDEVLEVKEPVQKTSEDECQICYNDLDKDVETLNSEIRACKTCSELLDVGTRLGKAKYIGRVKIEEEQSLDNVAKFEVEDRLYFVAEDISEINNDLFDKVWIINSFELGDFVELSNKRPSKLLLGNYVTRVGDLTGKAREKEKEEFETENLNSKLDDNDTASFLGLAYSSIGIKRVATLRMDVDNLGTIFSKGLKEISLAKISALSRLLDYYFKYYMNWICGADENKIGKENITLVPQRDVKRRPVSIIFSGGDDLLIVGAWNEIVELSYDIYETFKKFVCNNPDISISGGFLLSHHKFPFNKAQKEAINALREAKYNYGSCESGLCRTNYANCSFYESDKCFIRKGNVTQFYDLSMLRFRDKNREIKISNKWDKEAKDIKDFVSRFFDYFGKFDKSERVISLEDLPHLFIKKLLNIFLIWARKQGIYVLPLVRLMNSTEETLQKDKSKLNSFVNIIETELTTKYFGKDISTAHVLLMWIDFLTRTLEG